MKMFVWDGRGDYKLCVYAESVDKARELALVEIGILGGVGPTVRARESVETTMPHIYHFPNAEYAQTVSGETEELNILLEAESERRSKAEKLIERQSAELKEATGIIAGCNFALDENLTDRDQLQNRIERFLSRQ